jgi:hypothetical protein
LSETGPTALPVLLPFRPAAGDLSRPSRHPHTLVTIRLAILLVVQARVSWRAAQVILALCADLRGPLLQRPCYATVRSWLLRLGLHLLRRPLERAGDWVVLIDHTIQLGRHKCLLVLGLPLAALRATGYALQHQQVTVLALEVMSRSTGEQVAAVLRRARQRVGRIAQVVCDRGADLLKGLRPLQQDDPALVVSYDIRHLLAALLRAELRHDPRWAEFLRGCAAVLPKVRQTSANFLAPPTLRQKARYMNLEGHVRWAQQLLAWEQGGQWAALGQALGQPAEQARAWFDEHLGWLRGLRQPLADYAGLLRVIGLAEAEVHTAGLSRQTAAAFWARWQGQAGPASWRVWQFAQRVRVRLQEEGGQVPAGQAWLGSSLVIESLFGTYKELVKRSPSGEMGPEVLLLPVLTAEVTNELVREALETVSQAEVRAWVKEQLGESAQARKRELLGGTGEGGGPEAEVEEGPIVA